jgi:hypothetical protein
MKLLAGKKPNKKVSFGQEKNKVSRIEALTDVFQKPVLGLVLAVSLMIAWGDNKETFSKLPSFFFGIFTVSIIILSIIRPLSFVKKLELTETLANALALLEAASIGLLIGYCREQAFVGALACGLVSGIQNKPQVKSVLSRLVAAAVFAGCHEVSPALRVAALLSVSDLFALAWNLYLHRKRELKEKSNPW